MATVSGNVFDTGGFGCLLLDGTASQITFSHNQMQAPMAKACLSGRAAGQLRWRRRAAAAARAPLPHQRQQHVAHGLRRRRVAGGRLRLYNDAPDRLDATIADNTITLDNGGWDAGIDGYLRAGHQGPRQPHLGRGLAGIDVGTVALFWGHELWTYRGWQIIGNDVSGVTPRATSTGQSDGPDLARSGRRPLPGRRLRRRPRCSTRAPTTP